MKLSEINLGPTIFIGVMHTLALIILPMYMYFNKVDYWLFLVAFILYYLTGLGVTVGFHRYFSHKSFKATKFIEYSLFLLANLSFQSSIIEWTNDHRKHHKYTDTKKDPYNINQGFWYAHILWMFEKADRKNKLYVPDLLKKKYLVFEHKYYFHISFINNLIITLLIGYLFNDYIGSFLITFCLRVVFLWNVTWMINSYAHTFGIKPYSKNITAKDSILLGILAFGEGYHNYHHTYPSDYRNGPKWYNFDASKWVIFGLSKLGLTKKLIRVNIK